MDNADLDRPSSRNLWDYVGERDKSLTNMFRPHELSFGHLCQVEDYRRYDKSYIRKVSSFND